MIIYAIEYLLCLSACAENLIVLEKKRIPMHKVILFINLLQGLLLAIVALDFSVSESVFLFSLTIALYVISRLCVIYYWRHSSQIKR